MYRKPLPQLLAVLGLMAATSPVRAQPPAAPAPQVIRLPGGWLFPIVPELIIRTPGAKGSTTVISNSANGTGNTITINGGAPGVTIIKNARNGVGNTIKVTPAGIVLDLSKPGP